MNGKMTFGEKIKNIRKNKNITQGELGKRVGKTQQAICKLERMESQPRYEMVVKLARALDVSLAELTSDTSFSSVIQFFMPMIPPTVTAQEHAVRVVSEIVEKFWAEHPGIWICIEEIEEGRAL